jgi:hypothetical protein
MEASDEGDRDVQEIGQITAGVVEDVQRRMAKRAGVKPAEFRAKAQRNGGNQAVKSGERAECVVLRFPLERIHRWPWQHD